MSQAKETIFATVLASLCFCSTATGSAQNQSASSGDPHQTPIAADFQMKRCVNMSNALEAPNGNSWGRLYTVEDYERIAAAGFDTVRIPVRWSDYTGPAPTYRIHPDFAEVVDNNIRWALRHDLNIVLNVHHFEEIMDDPDKQRARYQALWDQISLRYSQLPDNVWFEALNEPNNNLSGAQMRRFQALALQIIRGDNPDRIVILGGEEWSGINSLGSNLATDDANVVYTFHYYDPFDFTHQKAEWLGEAMPEGSRGWGSRNDQNALANAVEIAVGFREAVQRPVFLGEFGVHAPVEHRERVEWVSAVKTAMEAANIPWCLWGYANTFALYEDESGWDEVMLEALTGD